MATERYYVVGYLSVLSERACYGTMGIVINDTNTTKEQLLAYLKDRLGLRGEMAENLQIISLSRLEKKDFDWFCV